MQKKKNQETKSNKIKRTQAEKERRMRRNRLIKFILKIIAVLALLIGLIAYAFTSPIFNITEIEVFNNEKFTQEEYIELSGLNEGNNIFNFVKLKVIASIEQNAYVESVRIKRKLPNKIEIYIEERTVNYLVELENEEYAYINNQGYILEISKEKLPLTIITGVVTDINNITPGNRLDSDDLEKLQNVIQIKADMENHEINNTLDKINIETRTNYILTFEKDAKEVHLGGINEDLSSKMLYMKYVLEEQEGVPGIIYLNQEQVYFSPK